MQHLNENLIFDVMFLWLQSLIFQTLQAIEILGKSLTQYQTYEK